MSIYTDTSPPVQSSYITETSPRKQSTVAQDKRQSTLSLSTITLIVFIILLVMTLIVIILNRRRRRIVDRGLIDNLFVGPASATRCEMSPLNDVNMMSRLTSNSEHVDEAHSRHWTPESTKRVHWRKYVSILYYKVV